MWGIQRCLKSISFLSCRSCNHLTVFCKGSESIRVEGGRRNRETCTKWRNTRVRVWYRTGHKSLRQTIKIDHLCMVEACLEMVEDWPLLIPSRVCDGLQSFMSVLWTQWCSLEALIVSFFLHHPSLLLFSHYNSVMSVIQACGRFATNSHSWFSLFFLIYFSLYLLHCCTMSRDL